MFLGAFLEGLLFSAKRVINQSFLPRLLPMGAFDKILSTTSQTMQGVCTVGAVTLPDTQSWFRMIPPERVGIRGEYDHYGLAKRVHLKFNQTLGKLAIANLLVLQRGRVVILHGQVASQDLLNQLVQLAMQVEGADHVELRGIVVNSD